MIYSVTKWPDRAKGFSVWPSFEWNHSVRLSFYFSLGAFHIWNTFCVNNYTILSNIQQRVTWKPPINATPNATDVTYLTPMPGHQSTGNISSLPWRLVGANKYPLYGLSETVLLGLPMVHATLQSSQEKPTQHYVLLIRHPPAVRHRSWSCVSTSGTLFAIIATIHGWPSLKWYCDRLKKPITPCLEICANCLL